MCPCDVANHAMHPTEIATRVRRHGSPVCPSHQHPQHHPMCGTERVGRQRKNCRFFLGGEKKFKFMIVLAVCLRIVVVSFAWAADLYRLYKLIFISTRSISSWKWLQSSGRLTDLFDECHSFPSFRRQLFHAVMRLCQHSALQRHLLTRLPLHVAARAEPCGSKSCH